MHPDCNKEAQEIGRLQGEMDSVKEDVREIKTDVKNILNFVNQTKGGWKTIMLISGCSSAFTLLAVKFLPFLPFR